MKTRFMPVAALASLAGGCVVSPPVATTMDDLPPLALQQDKPSIALVEKLLDDYFSSGVVNSPTVCAAIGDGRGPEAMPVPDEVAMMERFPRLAPLSRCSWTGEYWRDTDTDDPALLFEVRQLTCADSADCAGWAGYTAGSVASEAALYRMRYDDRWTFKRDERLLAQ